MSATNIQDVQDQVQKFWSPLFMKELREQLLLGSLVNKDYQGQIKDEGDTVYVSQVYAPEGQLKTVGVDADSFQTETLVTARIPIVANKRAVAGYKMADLVSLQSQINAERSDIRNSLLFAVEKKINDYLYSLVAPSTSAPDHDIAGVATFDLANLLACRKLSAKAKWLKEKGWWALLDPKYYNDFLSEVKLTSSDYVGDDRPIVGGNIATQRFGYNILEDNSRGVVTEGYGLLFHPDFLHLVMQTEVRFKISDLHSNNQFAFNLTADIVFGAALGIDGAKKHIKVTV